MKLCDKIRILRKARGLSQQDLGFKLSEETYGVSRQSISSWEKGDTEPKLENVRDLAKALDVSFDALLDENIDLNNNDILTEVLNHSYDKFKDYSYPITYEIFKTNRKVLYILTPIIISILIALAVVGIIGYSKMSKSNEADLDLIVYEYNNSIVESEDYTPQPLEPSGENIVAKLDALIEGLTRESEAMAKSINETNKNTKAIEENRAAISKAIEAANQAKIEATKTNTSIEKVYLLVIIIAIALPIIFFFSLFIAKYSDKSKIGILSQKSLVIYEKNTIYIKFENIEKIENLSNSKNSKGKIAINLKTEEVIILNHVINPNELISFYNELLVLSKM